MEKQLTKDEIQQIFDFFKIKELEFYDLQIELVDHFASAIEAKWGNYPEEWSFEQKIENVYDNLGRRIGLRSIVRGKSKMVFRQAYQSAFEHVKNAIRIPQIFLVIILIYSLQQAFIITENPRHIFKFMFFIPQIILFFGAVCFLINYYLSFKKKIYVFEQSFNYLLLWTFVLNNLFTLFNLWPSFPYSSKTYLLIATMLILFTILCLSSLLAIWKIFKVSKNRYEDVSNA